MLNIDSDDFEDRYLPETRDFKYHTVQMVNKDIFEKYQKILDPIYDEFLKEVREYDKKTNYDAINPYIMYFGFFYYPNLDKNKTKQ